MTDVDDITLDIHVPDAIAFDTSVPGVATPGTAVPGMVFEELFIEVVVE